VHANDRRWVVEIDRARDEVLRKMQRLLGSDQIVRISTRPDTR
jgi:hypothetical protein